MQLDFILEYLYDNFILVLYLAIFCIIFSLFFLTWIIKYHIGTGVLVIRSSTAQLIKASEPIGEGCVKFEAEGKTVTKKIYQSGSPSFMNRFLRPIRLYLHPENSSYVYPPSVITKIKGINLQDDSVSFQKLLNAEVIEQSVKGLVGTMIEKLIYMLAGGMVFIFIWEILKAVIT